MSALVTIELPDGRLVKKPFDELNADDLIVFDGPEFTAECQAEQARFEAEIEEAGGLEAWKRKGREKTSA